jgi:ribosomal protein S18 acetylase RimI-like enzyme
MLRALSHADGMVLKDVRLRALRDSPYAFVETLADAEGRSDDDWDDWAAEMSAEDGDSVAFLAFGAAPALAVGMAGGHLRREHRDEARVWGVWVDPSARGSGVGQQLVEAVVDWAAGRRCARVSLCVMDTSLAAISLYRSLGFEDEGCSSPSAHHEGLAELSMARALVSR